MPRNKQQLVDSTRIPTAASLGSSRLKIPDDGAQSASARRGQRLADPENHAKKQSFRFVDSNLSSKDKRAHVMRHHLQKKKMQRKHSNMIMPAGQIRELLSWSAKKNPGYNADARKEGVLTGTQGSSPDSDCSLPIKVCYTTQQTKLFREPQCRFPTPVTVHLSREEMPFYRTNIVSILNDDDHPSFAVRSNGIISRSHLSPISHEHPEQRPTSVNDAETAKKSFQISAVYNLVRNW